MTFLAHPMRVLLLAVCAAGLTGCDSGGGDGIATANSSGAPTSSAAADDDPVARARQYVDCLREHDIDVPDPDPASGAVRLPDRDQTGVRDAMRACQEFAPADGGSAEDTAAQMARMREYAACMRDRGVEEFPDPDPDKGPVFPKSTADLPGFADADRQCRELLGDTGKGSGK